MSEELKGKKYSADSIQALEGMEKTKSSFFCLLQAQRAKPATGKPD